MAFLPMNAKEMRDRGWNEVDFVYVCGDSYVDHPSFGAAIITRVLEDCGYKIAFLAQPNWKNDDDFTQFGKPRLGFMVSAGNIDSMVAHYTVAKRKRHDSPRKVFLQFQLSAARPFRTQANLPCCRK